MKDFTLAHIVINVTDIERAKDFYLKVFANFKLSEESDVHFALRGKNFGIWVVGGYDGKADENRVGLHHLAFKVDNMKELEEWEAHLKETGIEMQKGGITDDDFDGTGIYFRDPDNFRIEIHLG